jgi:type IV pilus assembly protein PilP
MKHGRLWWLLPCGLLWLMAGCSDEVGDLHQWTVEQRNHVVPRVMPVSKPRAYVPLPYTAGAVRDPFSAERLIALLRESTANNGQALLDKESRRSREPLESFPLDTMAMVGSLNRDGKRVALLKADGLLHQVQVGNYLGQNYGLVKQVDEQSITLREIVQDAGGDWIEHMTTLELQESK